jgi:hypothetical protein
MRKLSRVLSHLTHGGHALAEDLYKSEPAADELESVSRLADVVGDPTASRADDDGTTRFGYMLADARDVYPAAHLPVTDPAAVVVALKALGAAMVDGDPTVFDGSDPLALNSTIPPVYTYWGQFIDHDLTANTDRDESVSILGSDMTPLPPDEVVHYLRNLREPALNLDSLYGDGPGAAAGDPEAVPYRDDGVRFALDTVLTGAPGDLIPPLGDDGQAERDLPRAADGHALIGDGRNDENLIVAQLHLAFLRFHNAVATWVEQNDPQADAGATFARTRQLVEWHYQWLVVHDFLDRLTAPGVAQEVLKASAPNGEGRERLLFRPRNGSVSMPLEFSVAAFRFGHTMVRAEYDHNRNFGRPAVTDEGAPRRASFDELFQFTGKHDPPFRFGLPTLPDNWPIEWDRFTGTSPEPDRFARRIDTHLAPPLRRLLNEGNDAGLPRRIRDIVKHLAVRNLLRGYRLGIPTGQAAADAFGVPALTRAQLRGEADAAGGSIDVRARNQLLGDALAAGGFLDATPLWFYVLREAELQEGGDRLGQVGSRIVCETIIGQLRADDDSFVNTLSIPGDATSFWTPALGVKDADGGEIRTIVDLIRFAGLPA